MTPHESTVFMAVAGSLFWQPKAEDEPAILALLAARFIQPIQQGKLSGYALAPAGYRRWIGPHGVGKGSGASLY